MIVYSIIVMQEAKTIWCSKSEFQSRDLLFPFFA